MWFVFYTIVNIRGFRYTSLQETPAWFDKCDWTLIFHSTYLMLGATAGAVVITVSLILGRVTYVQSRMVMERTNDKR